MSKIYVTLGNTPPSQILDFTVKTQTLNRPLILWLFNDDPLTDEAV
jgi:hypothetical protein